MTFHRCFAASFVCGMMLSSGPAFADDEGLSPAGHSLHGEAFNEGPRQAAELMPGTGKVKIKITTKSSKARKFFNQGVGQLEGFWYFEAERSFRQAASFDTNCAMAYWGMAMGNVNNSNRAAGFIKRAAQLKTNASPREVMWIDAYNAYYTGKKSDADRRKDLVNALEGIIQKHPEEMEAKTFLAFQLWDNEVKGIPITSRMSVDALMNEVLAVEPLHPIHHARIHVWNNRKDERALNSAARCGQSAPAIAHMWHMPGHTFSALKRYDDAAWQQEASARTDHAYMMANKILPDQIHNFAHNNQWLCTDLLYCGRVREAVDLAKNMIELPRHPKYNTLNRREEENSYEKKTGSSMQGRSRLFDAILAYELWPDALALADTFYLEPTALPEEQARRLYVLALARFATGNAEGGRGVMSSMDDLWQQLKQERFEATEKAEEKADSEKRDGTDDMVKAMKGFKTRLDRVDGYRKELKIWSAIADGKAKDARKLMDDAKNLPKPQRARLWLALNDTGNMTKAAKELARSVNQAPDLALAAHLYWQAGEIKEATNTFAKLREISSRFDLDTPIFARLAPIAKKLDLDDDWRTPVPEKKDFGKRPSLDSLGPFRWQPYDAPSWTLEDAAHKKHSLSDYHGRPVLVVFYLGYGCPHCIEQLSRLSPAAKDFQAQGISIVAVSTDDVAGLGKTADVAKQDGEFPFPLLSDKSMKAFKAYRAYDDFEKMPLHGTFLVDSNGKVRWQDISFEPFTDMKFLVNESRRLLGLSKHQAVAHAN